MASHLAVLDDEWAVWRDVAIRSAGFPVAGLEVFGPGDEAVRLREVANHPRFREAVTWQNPAVVDTAIDKVACASPAGRSKRRQRGEVVASYWQRYCAKNDTIRFFGPLAWGRLVDDGPAMVARWPADREARQVHIEPWCLEALAESVGITVDVPLSPQPERDVRRQIDRPLARADTRPRPRQPDDLRRWAMNSGLPRRAYLLSPLEDKPIYVDFESNVLTGIAARMVRRAAAAEDMVVKFTEMLPTPEDSARSSTR